MYYTGDYIWGKDTFGDYLKDWEKIAKDFNKQLVETPIKIVQNVYKSVKDKTLTIEIELAGVKKEDITIKFEKNDLKVTSIKKGITYAKAVTIDEKYNLDSTSAKYENGLLTITINEKDIYSKVVTIN
jgi:HSP20 family molecular chaperone IbpA